jgi:hypothetical protein
MFSNNANYYYGTINTDYSEFIMYVGLIIQKYNENKKFITHFNNFKKKIETNMCFLTKKKNIKYIYNEYYLLSKIFLDFKYKFNNILSLTNKDFLYCNINLFKYLSDLNKLHIKFNNTINNLYVKNIRQEKIYNNLNYLVNNL